MFNDRFRQLVGRGNGKPGSPRAKPRKRLPPKRINDGFTSEADAIANVKRMWTVGRQRMYHRLEQWCVNWLFFRGLQYGRIGLGGDDRDYKWDMPEEDANKIRLAANLVQKKVMVWVARMSRTTPRVRVFPVTGDQDDKDRADIQNRILSWRARTMNFRQRYIDALTMTGIMGNAFLHPRHDPDGGIMKHPMDDLKDGDLELASDARFQRGGEHFQEGDEELPSEMLEMLGKSVDISDYVPGGTRTFDVVPPYEITIPDQHAKSLEEAPGILRSQVMSLQKVKETWPDHPKIEDLVDGTGFHGEQLFFMQRMAFLSEPDGFSDVDEGDQKGGGTGQNDANSYVLVHTYWGRRSLTRPKGIKVVICGEVLLEPSDIKDLHDPNWHGELPFIHLQHTGDGDTFWATCDLEQMLPVQTELNRGLSQVVECRDKTANPPWLDAKGSTVLWEDVENVPGEVIPYRRGYEPKYAEVPSMPAYVDKLHNLCLYLLDSISSDHQPSQGVSKAGDSGKKVLALQQADEARFSPFAETLGASLREFWLQVLCLEAQYVDQETLGYVVGEENERSFFSYNREQLLGMKQPESRLFTGEDGQRAQVLALRQQVDLEVRVVPGKSLQSIKQDMAQLVQLGAINPQQHFAHIMEAFGYGFDIPQIRSRERSQASTAALENDAFTEGLPVSTPLPYELHQKHLEVHADFTNTGRFRRMPEPQQQACFSHMELHEMSLIGEPVRQAYLKQHVIMTMMKQRGPLISPEAPQPGQPQSGGSQKPASAPARPSAPAQGGARPPSGYQQQGRILVPSGA